MQHLHDVLHAMPLWLQIAGLLTLGFASASDSNMIHEQRDKPAATRVVDNIGSWLAFAVIFVFVIAWYWHA